MATSTVGTVHPVGAAVPSSRSCAKMAVEYPEAHVPWIDAFRDAGIGPRLHERPPSAALCDILGLT